ARHGADLDRRLRHAHPPRDALQGAAAQGGARHRHGRGRLPADDAGPHRLGEPPAGDLVHFPLAQGAGEGAGRAGARPVAAVPRAGAARRRASATSAVGPARIGRHRAGRRRRLLHLSAGVLRRPGGPQDQLPNLPTVRQERWRTGMTECDYVLGGGIVPGSVTLVGGEPGIGKSTLLLQCAARLEQAGIATLYVSGEESPDQVRLRADRLTVDAGPVHVLGETRLEAVLHHARALGSRVVFVDSIQTTYTDELEGAPGNVGQVRDCAARLMRFAKDAGPAVFLVGHVTKGGGIAGPKTLEHIVDTVLYFEGESSLDHRILRAAKNRFGSVDEIGVFEM